MAQISTVSVPCLVIQLNNTIQFNEDQVIGKVLQVPCRNDFQDDPDYWFVPVKDSGILTTFSPIPAVGDFVNPPTFDSIKVFRVRDKLSSYTWWVYGTNADFVASCATCCGDSAVAMPGADGTLVLRFQPCDTLCIQNGNGDYYSVMGLPTLAAGQHYFPFGSYNNVALAPGGGTGYATVTDLLVFLNTNWTPFVWTAPGTDDLTLVATGGSLNDQLCVTIIALTPSA